jgi:hypothetical protein
MIAQFGNHLRRGATQQNRSFITQDACTFAISSPSHHFSRSEPSTELSQEVTPTAVAPDYSTLTLYSLLYLCRVYFP